MSGDAQTFQSGELVITLTRPAEGPAVIAWRGTSDARDPAAELNPFLTKLAGELAGSAVDVDFRGLDYMNSGTVSCIIHFSRTLDGLGIRARLLFDASIGWQRVNYVCMKNIAKTLKNLEVEG